MNKKGFTLVELLAVIALVAILSGIAVTNVVSSINNSKKNSFLLDAKRMVAKAEYLISMNREHRTQALSSGKTYSFSELNEKGEFQKDADDGSFNSSNTYVRVTKSGSNLVYCISVVGSRRHITTSSGGCVSSTNLTGIEIVSDN